MRITLNTVLIIGAALTLLDPRLAADTLYKKRAAVAIGFGDNAQSSVSWSDCSHTKKETHAKPPYWVDKGDDCRLHADLFGLEPSGQRYIAGDVKRASLFFPDVKRGEFVDFRNDSGAGLIVLTYRVRSLKLPYSALPTPENLVWNELSVAEGFANIGEREPALGLLDDVAGTLKSSPTGSFLKEFLVDSSVELFRIKPLAPEFSRPSHSALLELAHLRSALDPAPNVPYRPTNCWKIRGIIEMSHDYLDFGTGNRCGFELAPLPGGEPSRLYLSHSRIHGGMLVLDGIAWDDDTLVDSHIVYNGGPVFLRGVTFINCTFEIADTPRGDRMVDYAISRPPELSIGNAIGQGSLTTDDRSAELRPGPGAAHTRYGAGYSSFAFFAKGGIPRTRASLDSGSAIATGRARFYLPDAALKRRAIVGSSPRDLAAFTGVFEAPRPGIARLQSCSDV